MNYESNELNFQPNLLSERLYAFDFISLGRLKLSHNLEVDSGRSLKTLTRSLPQAIIKVTCLNIIKFNLPHTSGEDDNVT